MKQSEVTFDIQKQLRGNVEGPWENRYTGCATEEAARALLKEIERTSRHNRYRLVRVERTEIG